MCQGIAKDLFNFDPDPGHEHFIKFLQKFFRSFFAKTWLTI